MAMSRSSILLHPLAVFTVLCATPTVRSFARSTLSVHRATRTSSFVGISCRKHGCNSAIVLHASSIAATSWKPCAQPRFDEFASYTVGPWLTSATSSQSTTKEEVEEVMRSCGGAIQGIRELPLSLVFGTDDDDSSEDRTYHNRADGGFVYANDGTYSAGPEKWDWNASDESNAKLLMASLSFPGTRRMWLTSKLAEASKCIGNEQNVIHQINPKVLELSRQALDNSEGNANDVDSAEMPDINWRVIQRVRMPNSSQPWSLARAKWEKQVIENDDEDKEDATKVDETGSLMGWAFVESISAEGENNLFRDVVKADAVNVHMLAVCPATEVARSVVRCYDTNGSLQSVAFLDGSL